MKKVLLFMLVIISLASCHKEDEIAVVFQICNKTDGELSVEFSSWGDYKVSHGGRWITPHDFHASEMVGDNYEISMFVYAKDEDYKGLPPSITPVWDYITGIECMRVKVPATYFKDLSNWKIYRNVDVVNGEKIIVELSLTPEKLSELNK